MKIQLLAIGKTTTSYLQQGIDIYTKRLTHYMPFEFRILPDVKNTKAMTSDVQKIKEGEMFLSTIGPGDFIVLLDERGKEFTSRQFSEFIERKMVEISRNLIFVIGGPYCFSDEMYQRADMKLSFSKMTFSHEMIRLFFVEQVYRAMTIMRGEPYHHD
ncbi:MAG: 23S rRNA (pseudouridine(1915)-N(3))-methyltransferase RlmH [Muribaculaceae bacterium]|nr:23S rRNA (pseudouridine(1915)-N(3))-methyltransferase RlmH [Muribaculaceae bacterium]